MTILELLVRSDSAKALGWTLVHSLWEGAGVTLALAIVLAIARSSRVRYAASCVAMLGLLSGFAVTLYRLMPREIRHAAALRTLPLPIGNFVDDGAVVNHRTSSDASELLPWLAPIWLAGVLLFQLRCLAAWLAASRLRRIGVCGVPAVWVEKVDVLRSRLRMTRPVTLLESCFAEVPVVIGHLCPVILMPVGLLAGLPTGQIEAILLHEMAHIRRADYLVNLMQTLVEGLLFYHPAVWWISNAIRTERENCCDDLVVLTSGDAHEYATALAALAENRWNLRQAVLAATGGNLVNRIRRLLAQPESPRMTVAPVLSVGILVVTGAVALTAWQAPAPAAPRPFIKALPLVFAQAQTAPAAKESPYDKWLKEEVVYIITDQEWADFKKLQSDADRAHFIEQFWKRRDPTPGTPENELRDEHYRRIAYANDRFRDAKLPGWKTDRGRIYIEYGPPNEIDSHPSGGTYTRPSEQGGAQTVTYPFEQWRYRFIEGIGNNVILEFVDKAKTGEYRLTTNPSEKEVVRREDQAQSIEKLEAKRELDQRTAAIVTEELQKQMELVEQQLQSSDKQLEAMKEHGDLSVSQAQAEQVRIQVERLRALTEKLGSDRGQQQLLEAQEKLLEKQSEMERLEMNLRVLETDLAGAHPEHQESSVFVSGAGSQAVVVILPNRHMLVTIPFEFPANQYSVTASAVSSDGKTVWKETSTNGSHTMGGIALAPGSYTLNALVRDAAGPTQTTYVVNFSVK